MLILQRLSTTHNRSPNKLGSSAAGYLFANESYASAADRVMRKELGIAGQLTDLGVFEMLDNGSHKFVGVFVGAPLQQPIIKDDQIDALLRLSPAQIDSLMATNLTLFTPTFTF